MSPTDKKPEDEWLTPKEIADELRLTAATVRSWISTGALDAKRAGQRKWLVRRSELDRMLAGEDGRGPDNPGGRVGDLILAPHQSRDWSEESLEHVRRGSWFQYQNAYWRDALKVSVLAAPDPRFPFRVSTIAAAMASKAAAIGNLEGEDPGRTWREQTGVPEGLLPWELSPESNRPGNAALWEPFDAAIQALDAAMAAHDLVVEQLALEALSVIMHDLAEDLRELGYPWPETTYPLPGLITKPARPRVHYGPAADEPA